jgi:hypothetical protein
MIELALLTVFAVAIFTGLALLLIAAKVVIWCVFLPFRILFALVFLPLLLLKGLGMIVGAGVLLILAPVLAIAAVAVVLAIAAALLVPLLPVLFVVFAIWFVLRATRTESLITHP